MRRKILNINVLIKKEIGPDPGVYKFGKKVKVNYKKINDNKTNPHLTFSQRNALWLSDYEKSSLKGEM